jgi:hypothetical protein
MLHCQQIKESLEYEKASELVVMHFKEMGKRPLISFWKDTNKAKKAAIVTANAVAQECIDMSNLERAEFWMRVIKEIPIVGI